jgi:hypothetical protein
LYDFAWIRFGYEWNGFCDLAVVVAWQGARKEGRKNKSILLWLEDKHDQFTIHTDSIREQQQEQHVLPY